MMDTRAIVERQLTVTYEAYNKSYEQRLNDKKLCLTVWLAVLSFTATRPAPILLQTAILTYAPILLFWVLEGMRAVYTQLWQARIVQLERLLLAETISESDVKPLLFVSGAGLSFSRKLKALGYALFVMESVFAFYVLLAIVNLGFLALSVPH